MPDTTAWSYIYNYYVLVCLIFSVLYFPSYIFGLIFLLLYTPMYTISRHSRLCKPATYGVLGDLWCIVATLNHNMKTGDFWKIVAKLLDLKLRKWGIPAKNIHVDFLVWLKNIIFLFFWWIVSRFRMFAEISLSKFAFWPSVNPRGIKMTHF